ncbi:MAG: acetylglutamate kinase [Acidimicrobiales bacterium]
MSTYVVKLGGHVLGSLTPNSTIVATLARDLVALRNESIEVVLVHGGGPQIDEVLRAVGREGQFFEGLRITDETTMHYVAMALSLVNIRLVSALRHGGLTCTGLYGGDVSARSVGEPWGRVGNSPSIYSGTIQLLLSNGITPVMTPLAVDEHGQLLNCNADSVAGALASALKAEALILLSDVDQLRADPLDADSALSRVSADQVRGLVDSGAARDGMRPKMSAALDAIEGGAHRVLLANGSEPHALANVLSGLSKVTEIIR